MRIHSKRRRLRCAACLSCGRVLPALLAATVFTIGGGRVCADSGVSMVYKAVTYLTRLETRTKESNMCASH